MYAQTDLNTLPVGTWREGSSSAVVQVENTLYYSNGCVLEILALNEDNSSQMVSSFESNGRIVDLLVDGNIVYLAIEGMGLSIVSLENIEHPVETGFCPYIKYNSRILLKDNYVYCMSGGSRQIEVMDVSDPTAPHILHSLDIEYIKNAFIQDHYIFAACNGEGFKIFDIADPGSWVEVYRREGGYYTDVDFWNNQLATLDSDTIRILDISDPANPMEISKFKVNNYPEKLKFNGNFVFTGNNYLQSIDIGNPNSPVFKDELYLPGRMSDFFVLGNKISVSYNNGVVLYEFNEDGSIIPLDTFSTPGLSTSLAIRDHYAFTAQYAHGITILDIQDPAMPLPVMFIPVNNELTSVKIKDQYLFVSNWGLSVYDISDPLNPQFKSYLGFNMPSNKMYVEGNILYMAAGAKGLVIIDISNPIQPIVLSMLDTPGSLQDMDIHPEDHKIYLADLDGGLRIIDVSDLSAPYELGYINHSNISPIYTVKVIGSFAWIGSSNFGIRIYDISDYSNPVYVKDLNTGRGYDIKIQNQFALVAAGYVGLYIYEINRFEAPVLIGKYHTPGDIKEITLSDELLYCSDYYCGVTVFEFDPCLLLNINSGSKNNKCSGFCEGSIEIINVDHAFLPIQYQWSHGQNGSSASNLCNGTYSVTVTDSNNCMITENFTITEPPKLEIVQIQKTDITASSYGAISVQINGGKPPYKYQWKGPDGFLATSPQIDDLSAGCYILTVMDANDCILVSEAICIIDLTSTKKISADKIVIILYPNPANGTLHLQLDVPGLGNELIEKIEIFSTEGKVIKKVENYGGVSIDIQELSEGSYFLRMTIEGRFVHRKFIIAR